MNARSYKTSKGTELPLLNLKGKQYLEVKYRLVWFREDHPDWAIETEMMAVNDHSAYAKAAVRDETGRTIATSHKFESVQGFPDYIEKAETGAIGRALALIGYGTQFCADELDEGKRIVDAPAIPATKFNRSQTPIAHVNQPAAVEAQVETKSAMDSESHEVNYSEYVINFGRKYKGKKLKDVPKGDLESYIHWLENSGVNPGTPLSHQLEFLKSAFDHVYNDKQNAPTTEIRSH